MKPLCPTFGLVGFPNARLPPSVTLALMKVDMSTAMVAASVRVTSASALYSAPTVEALVVLAPAKMSAEDADGTVMVRSADRSPPPVARPPADMARADGITPAQLAFAPS